MCLWFYAFFFYVVMDIAWLLFVLRPKLKLLTEEKNMADRYKTLYEESTRTNKRRY
jgi:hypothetical protein